MPILNSFLHGLHNLFHKIGSRDPDISVMLYVMFVQAFIILDVSIIFNFRIPTSDELGNRWLVRLIEGSILWAINTYIFGIRESKYSEYDPLPIKPTLIIALLGIIIPFGFIVFSYIYKSS